MKEEYQDLFDFLDEIGVDYADMSFEKYLLFERKVTAQLKDRGFSVEKWWSSEYDSFGPLCRSCVIVNDATGGSFVASYG